MSPEEFDAWAEAQATVALAMARVRRWQKVGGGENAVAIEADLGDLFWQMHAIRELG